MLKTHLDQRLDSSPMVPPRRYLRCRFRGADIIKRRIIRLRIVLSARDVAKMAQANLAPDPWDLPETTIKVSGRHAAIYAEIRLRTWPPRCPWVRPHERWRLAPAYVAPPEYAVPWPKCLAYVLF